MPDAIILAALAVFAVYLMWIHWKLINRDFGNDIFNAINISIHPVIKGMQEFLTVTKNDVEELTGRIREDLEIQRRLIEEQNKVIQEQSNTMALINQVNKTNLQELHQESSELRDELKKVREQLDRCRKKEPQR